MSGAIVRITGSIRGADVAYKSEAKGGERFGQRVSVLTEARNLLGETAVVLVFDPRGAHELPIVFPRGEIVDWFVSHDPAFSGFKFLASADSDDSQPSAWDSPVGEPAESTV